jgi:hypothetical protein
VERRCVPLDRSRLFLPIPGSWAAFRVAPFADRREGAAWTARVSCCALYIISLGSVQLLRSAMPHSEKHQQAWPCLGLRESEGEHSLRQPARRMGGYGWMWRLGVYCCDSHLCEDPSLWPRWVSLPSLETRGEKPRNRCLPPSLRGVRGIEPHTTHHDYPALPVRPSPSPSPSLATRPAPLFLFREARV